MNITEPIFRTASLNPNSPALLYDTLTLTYAQLAGGVQKMAALLIERGIGPDDRVAVSMGPRPLHVITVLALARIGAASVGFNQAMPKETVATLVPMLGIKYLLHMPGVPADFIAATGLPGIEVDLQWLSRPTQTQVPVATDGSRVWRLGLSSGTTGTPKAMAWTHERSVLLLSLISGVIPVGPTTRFAAFFDLSAFAGIHQVLRHLLRGASVVLPVNSDPAGHVNLINSRQITDVFTSPAIALRMLEAVRPSPDAPPPLQPLCPGLRYLGLGGSGISFPQYESLRQWIAPNVQVQYGSTEGGLAALSLPGLLRSDPSVSGQILPWVEGYAVSPDGRALPPGQEGRLVFRSRLFCDAYEGDPSASAETFVGGWYRSGDSGSVDHAGLLRLIGREDGLLNLGGNKVRPETVESFLAGCPGISDAAVLAAPVANSGRSVLLATVTSATPIDEAALIARCRDALGPVLTPVRIVQVQSIPRSDTGKLDRRALARGITVNEQPPAPTGA